MDVWKGLETWDGGAVSFQGEGTSCRKAWRQRYVQQIPEKPGSQFGGLKSMIGVENWTLFLIIIIIITTAAAASMVLSALHN